MKLPNPFKSALFPSAVRRASTLAASKSLQTEFEKLSEYFGYRRAPRKLRDMAACAPQDVSPWDVVLAVRAAREQLERDRAEYYRRETEGLDRLLSKETPEGRELARIFG